MEDGIETGNVLRYNLAIRVLPSSSTLNVDVTPAAYLVTNANNTVSHNAAAGGSHFGFWYQMFAHPEGPNFDPNICPRYVQFACNFLVDGNFWKWKVLPFSNLLKISIDWISFILNMTSILSVLRTMNWNLIKIGIRYFVRMNLPWGSIHRWHFTDWIFLWLDTFPIRYLSTSWHFPKRHFLH